MGKLWKRIQTSLIVKYMCRARILLFILFWIIWDAFRSYWKARNDLSCSFFLEQPFWGLFFVSVLFASGASMALWHSFLLERYLSLPHRYKLSLELFFIFYAHTSLHYWLLQKQFFFCHFYHFCSVTELL